MATLPRNPRFIPTNGPNSGYWAPEQDQPFNFLIYLQDLYKDDDTKEKIKDTIARAERDDFIAAENIPVGRARQVGVRGNNDARQLLSWFYRLDHALEGFDMVEPRVREKMGPRMSLAFEGDKEELIEHLTDWAAAWVAVRVRCFSEYMKTFTFGAGKAWAFEPWVKNWTIALGKLVHRFHLREDLKMIHADKFTFSGPVSPDVPGEDRKTRFAQAFVFAYRMEVSEATNLVIAAENLDERTNNNLRNIFENYLAFINEYHKWRAMVANSETLNRNSEVFRKYCEDAKPADDAYDDFIASLKVLVNERMEYGLVSREEDRYVRDVRRHLTQLVQTSPMNTRLPPHYKKRLEEEVVDMNGRGNGVIVPMPIVTFPNMPDPEPLLNSSALRERRPPPGSNGGGDGGDGTGGGAGAGGNTGTGGGNTGTGGGNAGAGGGNNATEGDGGGEWQEVRPARRGGRNRQHALAQYQTEMPSRSGQPWDDSLGMAYTEDLIDRGGWWETGVRSRRRMDIRPDDLDLAADDDNDGVWSEFYGDDDDFEIETKNLAALGMPYGNEDTIIHPPSVRIGANDNALEKIFREFLRSQAEAARIGSGPTAQFDNPNGPDAAEYSPNKRRKILVADEARTIYPPFQVEQHMWATRA